MHLTQGTFSFLPDLTDEQIEKQIAYCLSHGWAIGIEYTDDPHPRNTFWEMFGNPVFDTTDVSSIMAALNSCRSIFPHHYVRLTAFDATLGTESLVLSLIVNRPAVEPGFRLVRTEEHGRTIRYRIESYAAQSLPEGSRY
jgi:ribulose-bisphosphate carboxylase small chain